MIYQFSIILQWSLFLLVATRTPRSSWCFPIFPELHFNRPIPISMMCALYAYICIYMVVDSLPFLSQIAQKHGFPWCSLGIFDILYFCVLSRQIWGKTKRQIAELQVPVPIHSLMNSLMIWVIANLSILESVLTDFEFVKCGPAPSTNNKSAGWQIH
jgi:hypothetical protein